MHEAHPARRVITDWLTKPVKMETTHDTGFKRGLNFLDATSTSRSGGHVAIQFNRNVIIDKNAKYRDGRKLASVVEQLARDNGFTTTVVGSKLMSDLRFEMPRLARLVSPPNRTDGGRGWGIGIGGGSTKWLTMFSNLLPIELREDFPELQSHDPILTEARLVNAFRFRGEKTHAVIYPNKRPTPFELYGDVDEAMLVYLKTNPERIVEI
jgi:hypothetical protein